MQEIFLMPSDDETASKVAGLATTEEGAGESVSHAARHRTSPNDPFHWSEAVHVPEHFLCGTVFTCHTHNVDPI